MRGADTLIVFHKVSIQSDELPRKHKDKQKPTKLNLNTAVSALLQTGSSTLAPRHFG